MIEFGKALRKAREAAHLSIEEVYEKTRISIKHLKAIEEGNFPVVPQTYVRAFIREYAQLVGLDEEETIRKYNELAAHERGIPKPPQALDNTNILPKIDESIEIVKPGGITPKHIEYEGTAEIAAPEPIVPIKKIPVHVETLPIESIHHDESSSGEKKPEPSHSSEQDRVPNENIREESRIETIPDDVEKRKLRSDIFHKMISPSTEKQWIEPEATTKPRRSVYDLKPPIPSEAEPYSQPPQTEPPKKRLEKAEKRILLNGAIIILIITVIVYAFFRFSSGEGQTAELMDSTSIKASIDQGKFIDSSQHALLEQSSLPLDTVRTVLPEKGKVLEPSRKTYPREDSLVLEAFTSSPVWFSVKMDTTKSERGNLSSNEHKVWKAKDWFIITLGDAGAVTFFLNGQELGTLGEEGAVVKNFTINRRTLSSGN